MSEPLEYEILKGKLVNIDIDLDTIKDGGLYFFESGHSYTNANSLTTFWLEVKAEHNTSKVYQEIKQLDGSAGYKRYFNSTWGTWESTTSTSTEYLGTCSTATNASTLTGTVTATQDSATVTGSSTLFTTELAINDTIIINGSPCYVSAIASNTSLTLSSVYANTTGTYTAYKANSAKTVTITGLVIAAGVKIKVTMTNQNLSYTPTLNVNSTSNDAIYDEGGNQVSNTFPAFFPAGATIEFYRNAANTAWVYENRLVKDYKLNKSWYTQYSNGKIRQGNYVTTTGANMTVTLLKNFIDTNYNVLFTYKYATEGYDLRAPYISSQTTSTFRKASYSAPDFYWTAEGF